MTGKWTDMFEQQPGRGAGRSVGGPPAPELEEPAELDIRALDQADYKPWVLQRGRGRPTMLLHMRRFEPRSGMWQGWALSYPTLNAVEYVGPRMVALDFGTRHFVIEGDGLDDLVDRLQHGMVTVIQEYNATTWPARPPGPVITAIRRLGGEPAAGR